MKLPFNLGTDTVVKPVVSLLLVIAIAYATKKAYDAWKKRHVGKATYNKNNLNKSINYDNVAAAVHKATDTGLFGLGKDVEAIEKQASILMSMNDDELKYVYTRYDAVYGKGDKTMYDAFSFFCIGCKDTPYLLKRMERLGIV